MVKMMQIWIDGARESRYLNRLRKKLSPRCFAKLKL